ncbi:acetolactate synthase [Fictibacillus barbaricus]|uniref:Acetolactate synthase large subunit n=1 Tax=Fictibacillus barbaricus TaxID=182136 RepID=A0ABS2Z7W3_9BACL|nr:acetolactate synthase large subunit [Fictibacillus barbaricus]MBN3544165.1 acetolactate synthase large subunit [Fictibacillus barbaricus]GGB69439.1 acetolactate synthase [Fictibacillus barbaricus]
MKTTDVMVKCLENEGVKYIFGIPGEENIDLIHSLSFSDKIQFVAVRHEQGAAFMADVYGRLTGKAGVCLATLGPGATNLITGIGDANLDRAPLVAITGQAGLERMHKESHQYIDVVAMFTPVTKWSIQVKRPETIPEIVRKAFKLAEMEKPGAVHIELPEDIAADDIEDTILPTTALPKSVPTVDNMEKAIELIQQSKKPFIIAGNGVIRQEAAVSLQKFAESINVPVAHTFMAKGVLPPDHPLNMYTVGLQMKDFVLCGIHEADLIIAVGYDFIEYLPMYWNETDPKQIVHIDTQAAEVDLHYPVASELVGDIRSTLEYLTQNHKGTKGWMPGDELHQKLKEELAGINKEPEPRITSDTTKIKIKTVLNQLQKIVKDNTIVISDVGAHKMWIARNYQPKLPNRVIISNGFASMGIALPGAIGAKFACPDDPVVCIMGDGGFLMNGAEIETAKRLGLAFTIIVLSDSKYGLIDWKLKNRFNESFGIDFQNPDLIRLAESFGIAGMRVNHPSELESILTKAVNMNEVVLVEIPIDNKENLKLSKHLGKHICRQ